MPWSPSSISEIRAALAADSIDVAIGGYRDALTAVLFAMRSARLQVFLDYRVPWYSTAGDRRFDANADGAPPCDMAGLRQLLDAESIAPVERLSAGIAFGYIGRFARLSALDLANLLAALSARPGSTFHACGIGDSSHIVRAFDQAGLSRQLVIANTWAEIRRAIEIVDVAVEPIGFEHDLLHVLFGAAGKTIRSTSALGTADSFSSSGDALERAPSSMRDSLVSESAPRRGASRLEDLIRRECR
jgi:hypothetical protein